MLQRFLTLAALYLFLTLAAGCSQAPPGAGTPSQAGSLTICEISLSDAVAAWQNKSAVFIDVRSAEEFSEGHIPGAKLLPLPLLESRFAEIPKDRPVILVCRSARRSAQANLLLQQLGFQNTASMKEGMLHWSEAQEKD